MIGRTFRHVGEGADVEMGEREDTDGVDGGTRCTEPGTEYGAVHAGGVMRMRRCVPDGLWINQAAQQKENQGEA